MLGAEAMFEIALVTVSAALSTQVHARAGFASTGATIGVALGALLYGLPLAVGATAVRAAVSARYFREQELHVSSAAAPSRLPSKARVFRGLFVVELAVGAVCFGSLFVGAIPGALVVLIGAGILSATLVRLGLLAALLGALALWLYVWPGFVFASRILVLKGGTPMSALRASWKLAAGRRGLLLALLTVAYGFESIGLAGLLLFLVGVLFTLPCGRVLRDTAVTSLFVRVSSQARARASEAKPSRPPAPSRGMPRRPARG